MLGFGSRPMGNWAKNILSFCQILCYKNILSKWAWGGSPVDFSKSAFLLYVRDKIIATFPIWSAHDKHTALFYDSEMEPSLKSPESAAATGFKSFSEHLCKTSASSAFRQDFQWRVCEEGYEILHWPYKRLHRPSYHQIACGRNTQCDFILLFVHLHVA